MYFDWIYDKKNKRLHISRKIKAIVCRAKQEDNNQ